VQPGEKILLLGMSVLLGIVLFLAAGWGIYYLYRLLFSRTSYREKESLFWKTLFLQLLALGKRCRKIWIGFKNIFFPPEEGEGTRGYKKLLLWGKRSGLPRRSTETPGEYALRLKKYFPLFQEEIRLIIEGYHDEVYGELRLEAEQQRRIRLAGRKLSGPLRRLAGRKKWFYGRLNFFF